MITPEGVIVPTYAAGLTDKHRAIFNDWLTEVVIAGLKDGAMIAGKSGPGVEIAVDWEFINSEAARWVSQRGLDEAMNWIDNYSRDIAEELTRTTMRQVQEKIAEWITAEETMPDLVKRVRQIFDNPRRALTIATTEATRAYAEANTIAWRDIGAWGREWRTAQDEIVCKICGPLAGQRAEMGGAFAGIANPPAHPNCRCSLVPVVLPEVAAVEPYTPLPAPPVTQTDRGYDAGPVTVDKPIIPPGFSIPTEAR